MMKEEQKNRNCIIRITKVFTCIFILLSFSNCSEETIVKEDIDGYNKLRKEIYYRINKNDSTICLKDVFAKDKYDNIYFFPRYTSTEKINSLINIKNSLPYEYEVKGNEDLLVLSKNNNAISYIILKDNIILYEFKKNKYAIDSTILYLRHFQRNGKNVIYILDKQLDIDKI